MLASVTIQEFVSLVALIGICGVAAATIPVFIMAKRRRMKRRKTHLTCRLCGYRFIGSGSIAECPHCQARNR